MRQQTALSGTTQPVRPVRTSPNHAAATTVILRGRLPRERAAASFAGWQPARRCTAARHSLAGQSHARVAPSSRVSTYTVRRLLMLVVVKLRHIRHVDAAAPCHGPPVGALGAADINIAIGGWSDSDRRRATNTCCAKRANYPPAHAPTNPPVNAQHAHGAGFAHIDHPGTWKGREGRERCHRCKCMQ